MNFIIIFVALFVAIGDATEIVYKWKKIEYNDLPRESNFLINGYKYYNYENCVPTGFAYHIKSGLMFIAVARRSFGVPSTLNVINVKNNPKNTTPKLTSFPNYELNDILGFSDHNDEDTFRKPSGSFDNFENTGVDLDFGEDIGDDAFADQERDAEFKGGSVDERSRQTYQNKWRPRITSVYVPMIDKYDRLWFIDTGLLEYRDGTKFVQKSSLWVIDLSPDSHGIPKRTVIRRHVFPDGMIINASGLRRLTVDVYGPKPEDTFVYIPNLYDNRTVVYDFNKKESWYFSHYSFKPDPVESDYNVEGVKYHWEAGVIDINLGWKNSDGFRTAYYFAGSSTAEFAVSTRVLRNRELAPYSFKPTDFQLYGYRGQQSQSIAQIFDSRNGVFYYAELQTKSIKCWNINKPLLPRNIGTAYYSYPEMIYPNDIKFDRAGNLWFMSNRFSIWLYRGLSWEDYNFHIFRINNVGDAIKNTVCEPSHSDKLTNIALEDDTFKIAQSELHDYLKKTMVTEGKSEKIEDPRLR